MTNNSASLFWEGIWVRACFAIIVASGRGTRFGSERPKQYLALGGKPILQYALKAFADHPRIQGVRAVIHPDDQTLYDEVAGGLDLLAPVFGGETRQDSVRLGLESLEDLNPATVLIHDGARPMTSKALIDRVIDALDQATGAVPALPISDTLKRVENGLICDTIDRGSLFRAQTPQGFAYRPILEAHQQMEGQAMTDDAAIAEANGLDVITVRGDESNLKITEQSDLERATLRPGTQCRPRTGMGFDVHRLAPGDGLILMGLTLPERFCMVGHSDADVGLHAVTDALLGALAAGDIGSHFPPSDPKWKGADSTIFLNHAADLIRDAGGIIEHVDVTLICERPKIGPYRAVMVDRLAGLLAISQDRVSIKATTTEGLGFTGRGEGLAAQAVATVSLPS